MRYLLMFFFCLGMSASLVTREQVISAVSSHKDSDNKASSAGNINPMRMAIEQANSN